MSVLTRILREAQNSGIVSPGEAIAILGCCESMHEGLTRNNIVHPDNFTIQYGTRSVEVLDILMKDELSCPTT